MDEYSVHNYQEARQTGLKVGACHFFSYDSSGITQAGNFIDMVEIFDGMLPPVMDVELYGNKKDDPLKGFSEEEPYVDLNVFAGTVEEWDSYGDGHVNEDRDSEKMRGIGYPALNDRLQCREKYRTEVISAREIADRSRITNRNRI